MNVVTRPVRLARKIHEADHICSFEFVCPDGNPLPPFSAGAHINIHLKESMSRCYSLCNNPGERHRYLIAVLLEPKSRGGSEMMHGLKEGDTVRISNPVNRFPLSPDAQHSILLAGGIGITPILSMAESLSDAGASFRVHFATRSRQRAAFIDRIRGSTLAGKVDFHFDDGSAEQQLDIDLILNAPHSGTHVYVCGPNGFIDRVLTTASAYGWPDAQVHREHFVAPVDNSGESGTFEVQIASTGTVVSVGADETVVAALAAHGVMIPVSCEQGVCGTCLTRVLEGLPDHRDAFLTPEEQATGNQFMPCCSRSLSRRLVLDL